MYFTIATVPCRGKLCTAFLEPERGSGSPTGITTVQIIIYIYIYVHLSVQRYVCACMHACKRLCVYKYIHTHISKI